MRNTVIDENVYFFKILNGEKRWNRQKHVPTDYNQQ